LKPNQNLHNIALKQEQQRKEVDKKYEEQKNPVYKPQSALPLRPE
jgi:hypothetical protein